MPLFEVAIIVKDVAVVGPVLVIAKNEVGAAYEAGVKLMAEGGLEVHKTAEEREAALANPIPNRIVTQTGDYEVLVRPFVG